MFEIQSRQILNHSHAKLQDKRDCLSGLEGFGQPTTLLEESLQRPIVKGSPLS